MNDLQKLRIRIQEFLNIRILKEHVSYDIIETTHLDSFERQLISYQGTEGDKIKAYLFFPTQQQVKGSILVHHQHNGERHLGKSEVAGLIGDPLQAFCPALASKGYICLAPDSICFEDRRSNMSGTEASENPDEDFLQHYNQMCYRLLKGQLLMSKVIEESTIAISLLEQLEDTPKGQIGILGHSYGGNTVLFHSALDERIAYSCSSGAACSYANKLANGTGIEMAEVIPGFIEQFDIHDLVSCTSPRRMLILSAEQDKYAKDAGNIVQQAKPAYQEAGVEENLIHKHYLGGHALTQERFDDIINWCLE